MVTDFAADVAFGSVPSKLEEHYGIDLGHSTIERITLRHASQISEHDTIEALAERQTAKTIIAQMDGSMLPLVRADEKQVDKRKGKAVFWKEAKMCLAFAKGSKTAVYGGTLLGGVEGAGEHLSRAVHRFGFGEASHVHAVGDGAPWIAEQFDRQFGTQQRYLLDFFHVCDYLAAAAKVLEPDAESQKIWMDNQKDRLKCGHLGEVLAELAHRCGSPDDDVTKCLLYLRNRLQQLDYRRALDDDLPIGSGAIESAHKHVIQQRLKKPGAWWRPQNAERMMALRLNRANGDWTAYWGKTKLAA